MSKATLDVRPAADLSKLDRTDWTRETWRAAYAMARRMVRNRQASTAATAWTWYLDAARKRFGASGWRVAQAAGRIVFDARTVGYARAGSVAELERQGLVRTTRRPRPGNLTAAVPYRAATFERLRDCGLNMAWTHDPLASSANKGLRVCRAQQRRKVARIMAEDRFALTVVGVLALRRPRPAPPPEPRAGRSWRRSRPAQSRTGLAPPLTPPRPSGAAFVARRRRPSPPTPTRSPPSSSWQPPCRATGRPYDERRLAMPYLLRMADHFHYMDESESYDLDRYETAAAAVA